jgi:hypothetical protein
MIKFTELKTEILDLYDSISPLIKLTDELSSACDKYSKVKELFWKVIICETFVHNMDCIMYVTGC